VPSGKRTGSAWLSIKKATINSTHFWIGKGICNLQSHLLVKSGGFKFDGPQALERGRAKSSSDKQKQSTGLNLLSVLHLFSSKGPQIAANHLNVNDPMA